ncbi:tetratricopeptide repeat protein [Oribacterium sp. WCC10]|uniref:tetratricopeptide repeat protein n=1 Tax=Oribacterium sp. WCC10 TaxID=1855343 RepID=UPI0008E6AD0F|nr:tetratricopeptide repeat protein [Oribacterium sp. WCC10]SFG19467.1 Tetratricopeptide repeat-containing protein [Oribacterium sp. WCC10]
MGLLLCNKGARHPFYYEKLDIDIWSIQELSYVIYRYPVIIPSDFVDHKLTTWIRDELSMGILAAKLEQFMGAGDDTDQERLLLMILRESNYYTQVEISRFESEYKKLRNIDRHVFLNMLGDTYFRMGRYGRAIESYEESLLAEVDTGVQMKLAGTYVTVMQFRKAADLYEEVYVTTVSQEPLRKLYFISKLEPSVNTIEKYLDTIDVETLADWEQEYDNVQAKAEHDERAMEIFDLYQKSHSEFREHAKIMVLKWKREYRAKI